MQTTVELFYFLFALFYILPSFLEHTSPDSVPDIVYVLSTRFLDIRDKSNLHLAIVYPCPPENVKEDSSIVIDRVSDLVAGAISLFGGNVLDQSLPLTPDDRFQMPV